MSFMRTIGGTVIAVLASSTLAPVAEARFLQTDPVGYKDQVNLYAYVNNDPTNAKDPSGTDTVVEMRYYILGNAPIQGDYGHQYVWLRDTKTGETVIVRAGPSARDAISSPVAISNSGSNNRDGTPNYIKPDISLAKDSPDGKEPARVISGSRVTLKSDIGEVVGKARAFNDGVQDAKVPYYPQTQNSNSYANSAYQVLTGAKADTRAVLPGSDNDIRSQIPRCESTPKACGK